MNEPPRKQSLAAARCGVALQPPSCVSGIDFKINVRKISMIRDILVPITL